MKELADFELRYWKAIAPEAAGMSAEQMAAVMAMYPMLKQAMERLQDGRHEARRHAARDDHDVRGGEEQGRRRRRRASRAAAAASAACSRAR